MHFRQSYGVDLSDVPIFVRRESWSWVAAR